MKKRQRPPSPDATAFAVRETLNSERNGKLSALREFGRIGVIGATGAVGREMLAILDQRRVTADQIQLFASSRSDGEIIRHGNADIRVNDVRQVSAAEFDCFLVATDAATSAEVTPKLVKQGALVVDNSSAFRNDPTVPLVIPEVNGDQLSSGPRLVANPNCSTVILLMALNPIREAFGIDEIQLATYQAVSGAGNAAISELRDASQAALNGEAIEPKVFPEPCAFNVFCHESPLDQPTGLCGEELKIITEARRIWNSPDLPISPICIRVPVFRAHSQAIWVRLTKPASRRQLRDSLRNFPGIRLIDDPVSGSFPTPLAASGRDEVLVGRLRPARIPPGVAGSASDDAEFETWTLFACGDQLRKGAALERDPNP